MGNGDGCLWTQDELAPAGIDIRRDRDNREAVKIQGVVAGAATPDDCRDEEGGGGNGREQAHLQKPRVGVEDGAGLRV